MKKKQPTKKIVHAKKHIKRHAKLTKRHAKLTFVPHRANQYRPHLIRRYGLAMVFVLAFGLLGTHNFISNGSVLGVREPISPADLLRDTNAQRAQHHLPALKADAQLSKAAYLKAKDMLRQQYWAHTAPDGTTPWHWFNSVGYEYDYAGENLAKNFASAEATTAAWMASAEHRANILDKNYAQAGFAVVNGVLDGKQTSLVVALYGSPVDTTTATLGATHPVEEAPLTHGLSPIARFGVALQSVTPAVLGSFMLLLLVTVVAMMAHFYRKKLPKHLRQSWYRHHGLYKAVGMTSVLVIIIALYGGGQI